MTDDGHSPLSLRPDEPRDLVLKLRRLVAERTPADVEIAAAFRARSEETKKRYQDAQRHLAEQFEAEKAAAEAEHEQARQATVGEFEAAYNATRKEYERTTTKIAARYKEEEATRQKAFDEVQWEANAIYEATRGSLAVQLKQRQAQLDAQEAELAGIDQAAIELVKRRRQWRVYPPALPTGGLGGADPVALLGELAGQAQSRWHELAGQAVPRFFEGAQPVGLFLLLWIALAYPFGLLTGWNIVVWLPVTLAGGAILGTLLTIWLYFVARRQTMHAFLELRQALARADEALRAAREAVRRENERQMAAGRQKAEQEISQAGQVLARAQEELRERKQAETREADDKYPARLAELIARRDRRLQEIEQAYTRALQTAHARFDNELDDLLKSRYRETTEQQQQYDRVWRALSDRWGTGVREVTAAVDRLMTTCRNLFPDWDAVEDGTWKPPAEMPAAMPLGYFTTRLEEIEGGIPADAELRPGRTEFTLPALFPFRDRSLILLKARGEGRSCAVRAIQSLMLRLLVSMPLGKVRFTIVDPVGLGENFSAFMHLADYNDQFVTKRIWTEAAHIEQRLGDLTEHMENVIQVYLRNEYASIQEYNASAGEMAEPYRILALANFPANVTESAFRRLVSLAASGARCGVYTLLSVDGDVRLPRNLRLAELEANALTLRWEGRGFVWEHPDLGDVPLEVTAPPPDEQFTRIVRAVGEQIKDADRVEVPFACVVPGEDQWWTADSRGGVEVPLGRAGALKLQHLRLGKGTSQHVLISGKTGSGKSTLLHALITSLAIRYSPEEAELYLVDFKKGVEFKAYAEMELPHARVIAIESEREFGLSVLERLDGELKRRGDLFRQLGVQDIQGFRTLKPQDTMPRTLLIIDEFQELFVEDDRIAQTAALLLDRLARQGRAFGIHVLLGSQTLGGAYSLPRSTIGQMAVRIALQCSESDAHLILSEENTAARLLRRPGEAIYNDANGLYEGNHPFQVVWLPDHERMAWLERIQAQARQRGAVAKDLIVFEGNAAADPERNSRLAEALAAPAWPQSVPVPQAWVGAPVAIKEPTFVPFARQNGANLLVIGPQEEEAVGVLGAATLSLAAQLGPPTRFFILDGARPESPWAGYWNRLAGMLPHEACVAAPRRMPELVAEIAAELARRQASDDETAPPWYLVVFDLGRFRDLRRSEDDFGFSRRDDQPVSPAKQFSTILHDGPMAGIHTLLWCDSYNNATRALDRQGLRDLELRVLFQMNATDSSNLMDSPAAGQLGVHRAILYDEGDGSAEKFRPYGPPSEAFLTRVGRQLHARMPNPSANEA